MVKGLSITALQTLFRQEYNNAVAQYQLTNAWDGVAMVAAEIPSTGASETYRWLQDLPEFQQWVGDLNAGDLAEYSYTLVNQPFAAAVGVHKDEIDDDKDGLILARINLMAGGEFRKWGKLVDALLRNGTTNLAFDGIAFFADPTGVRVNDNLLAGTISASAPTVAQVLADVNTVMGAMGTFVDSRGEVVGIIPDTFVVHPLVASVWRTALLSPTNAGLANAQTINQFAGLPLKIVVDPGLTDINDFYALATSYAVGALIKQRRSPVQTFIDETQRWTNGRLNFGAEFRGNAGYGLPLLGCKVVSAVA
jgi:phage major head subunit gpT-like protein